MIFWDSSAIVPLIVDEPSSLAARAVLRQGDTMIVWWGTAIEVWSALCRRVRDGTLSPQDQDRARRALAMLSDAWHEVVPSDILRDYADNLLRRHPLAAADALQLAAALTLATGRPKGHRFACLDDRLALAARGEGFDLVM